MIRGKTLVGAVVALNVVAGMVGSAAADPQADAQEMARESWREAIVRSPAPHDGCFEVSFPSTLWHRTSCITAPDIPFVPRAGASPDLVGNGTDYAAESSTVISRSVGSFPSVTGVTSETDGGRNDYSIQLNSNFMVSAACNGVSGCRAWQQFVYSSSTGTAFMQYWLIGIGKCPAGQGWNAYGSDCYKNSAAKSVPKIGILQLAHLKMSGTAVAGGNDTLVFTDGTTAYSTSGKDTVTDLSKGWTASEFNIIGDGSGSEAKFNTGSSITLKIALTNGTTSAPTCGSKAGTTGETNNLNLDACKASGGTRPYIEFTESN